ncbi:MAG: MFS transporter [Candidatus Dormibacteraceae bacterium]
MSEFGEIGAKLRRSVALVISGSSTVIEKARKDKQAGGVDSDQRPSLLVVVTLLAGAFLSMMDFNVVNIALPTISSDLHASPAVLELVVAGYGVPYALLLVFGGRLGDACGRRRLFMIGMASFTVASAGCGLAPRIEILVLMRAVQGGAAALMVPQVLATLQATSTGRHRARATGLYAATGGMATVVGQLLGGVIIALNFAGMSWRPIFLLNVPVGIVALLIAASKVPETQASTVASVDGWGTVLLAIAVVCLLVPLAEGGELGWPLWIWFLLAGAPIVGIILLVVERKVEGVGRVPLLPPRLLAMRSMWLGLVAVIPYFATFGGFMFVIALALQRGAHFSPLYAGLSMVPLGAGFFISSISSSWMVGRFGGRIIVIGSLFSVLGLLLLALIALTMWPALPPLFLGPALFIFGWGEGYVMGPLFRVVLSKVPDSASGVGSGVLVTVQQISLALGVAVLGGLFSAFSGSLGIGDAFALTLGLQAMAMVMVAALTWMLPG